MREIQFRGSTYLLPSNKNFGLFFSALTIVVAFTNAYYNLLSIAIIFLILSAILATLALLRSEILTPLNILWTKFGLLLSLLVSPIMLGLVFFGILTPVAFMLRLFRRDELALKKAESESYWKPRNGSHPQTDFRHQF